MKRTAIFSLFILFAAVATTAFIPDNCIQQYWGTKKMYQPADTGNTVVPAGYRPVFINYAGRHGARHLTSINDLLLMQQMLGDAATANALTGDGQKLKDMITKLLVVEKKEDCGLLTEAGKQEQWGIGSRMKAHYPSLFNNPATHLRIVTTKQKRTEQSAAAFTTGLGRAMQNGGYTQLADNDSVQLRFFEVSAGYKKFKKKGDWTAEVNKLEHTDRATQEKRKMIRGIFSEAYANRLLSDTATDKKKDIAQNFIDAIFNIATLPYAMHTEILAAGYTLEQVDVRSLFSCDEMAWLEYDNSAQDFLLKGPGTDLNGIQVRNAAPLLVDFINSTDNALKGNTPAVIARFAHAETMAPFAAMLEIKGAATPTKDIFSYDKVWDVSSVIGFSANAQWILYKGNDAKKDVLIKILYNEKPVEIPVVTTQFPYYKWSDVRAFYINKLNKLHVSLDGDMLEYLVNLK